MNRKYRVVFMERPLGEIVASQAKMLLRQGQHKPRSSTRLMRTFSKQVGQVRQVLKQNDDSVAVLSVRYQDALSDAYAVASRVNQFLGGGLNESAMVKAIDPALRHEQSQAGGSHPA